MPDPITPIGGRPADAPHNAMLNALPRVRHSGGAAGARAAAALLALGLPGVAVLGVAIVGAATPRAAFAADGEEPPAPASVPAPAGEAPAPAPIPQEGEEPPAPHEPSPEPVGAVTPPEAPPAPEAEEPIEVTPPKDDPSAAGAKKRGSKDDPRAGLAGGNSLGKYLGTWADGLYASGGASLSSRNYSVDGSEQAREAYDQQFNFQGFTAQRIGPFQQNMDLTLQGKVFNLFNINARLTNSRQGNYFNQIFGFNYDAKGTKLDVGDVAASLPGNQFVAFSRTLRGLQFGRDFGNGMSVKGLASLTQSVARTGSFRGNESVGPYTLNATSLLPGTVTVRKNGQPLTEGTDYVIQYDIGSIKFLGSNIITAADTIDFSYESQSFNSTPGLLTGARFDQTLGKGSAVGVTWLRQTPTSGRRGVSVIEERFPISSNLGDRYSLAGQPETGATIEVAWAPQGGGVVQVLQENVDYLYNRSANSIQLIRPLAPDVNTSNLSLRARYKPQFQTGVASEKTILGLDGQTQLGQGTTLAFQFGSSQGRASNQSGTAMSLTANFRGNDKLSGDLTWTDIGAGFSGLDTVSNAFLQIQKGLRGNLNYSPSKALSIRTSINQSRIATQQTSVGAGSDAALTPQLAWNNNTGWNTNISLALPNWPRLDLTHTQTDQSNSGANSSRSSFVSDQFSINYPIGGIANLSGSLGRTVARGRSVFLNNLGSGISNGTVGGTLLDDVLNNNTSTSNSASNTARVQLSVTPASWISLVGSLGASRNSFAGASGSTTSARDSSLGVTLPLTDRFRLGFNLQDSSNGRTTVSNGTTTGTPSSFDGQRTRTTGFTAQYMPLNNLDLTFDSSRSLSLIPGFDNTDNVTTNITAAYQPSPILNLVGSFGNQKVAYIGSQRGTSDNRTFLVSAQAGPFGNLTFTASLQRMNVGSALFAAAGTTGGASLSNPGLLASSLQQDMDIFSLRADYPVGGNRSLFLQWESMDSRSPLDDTDTGNGTGVGSNYYSSSKFRRSTGTVGMEIRLNELMGFTLNYNLIDMLDRVDPRYSYRANAFNVDLSARF